MTANIKTPADLQEMLRSDTSGIHTRELLALVERASKLVENHLQDRHASAELRAAQQLRLACDATDRVLRSVWESLHGRNLD
jgi:hypothetical protein